MSELEENGTVQGNGNVNTNGNGSDTYGADSIQVLEDSRPSGNGLPCISVM